MLRQARRGRCPSTPSPRRRAPRRRRHTAPRRRLAPPPPPPAPPAGRKNEEAALRLRSPLASRVAAATSAAWCSRPRPPTRARDFPVHRRASRRTHASSGGGARAADASAASGSCPSAASPGSAPTGPGASPPTFSAARALRALFVDHRDFERRRDAQTPPPTFVFPSRVSILPASAPTFVNADGARAVPRGTRARATRPSPLAEVVAANLRRRRRLRRVAAEVGAGEFARAARRRRPGACGSRDPLFRRLPKKLLSLLLAKRISPPPPPPKASTPRRAPSSIARYAAGSPRARPSPATRLGVRRRRRRRGSTRAASARADQSRRSRRRSRPRARHSGTRTRRERRFWPREQPGAFAPSLRGRLRRTRGARRP